MTYTGEESLGKPPVHADLYDVPIYARLLKRLIAARFLARSEHRPDPKYVVLSDEEALMFRIYGSGQRPEQIYGYKVLTRDEVVLPC